MSHYGYDPYNSFDRSIVAERIDLATQGWHIAVEDSTPSDRAPKATLTYLDASLGNIEARVHAWMIMPDGTRGNLGEGWPADKPFVVDWPEDRSR